MSGHCRVTPDVGATGFALWPSTASAHYIGRVATVVGSCTLARADDVPAQINVGDAVALGDVIETAAGGTVGIRFTDGTVFNLSNRARIVMTEFASDGDQPSARFDVTNGSFAFIAGEMAKTGQLGINTPFGIIRSRSGGGGIGMLSLVSLFLAALPEAEANPNGTVEPDDGSIEFTETENYKELPFGKIRIIVPATATEPERIYDLDDASKEIVIQKILSSTVVNYAQLSISDMLRGQDWANAVWHIQSLGQTGPAGFGNGGSGGLPPEFQLQDQNNSILGPGGANPFGGTLPVLPTPPTNTDVLPVLKEPPPQPTPDTNFVTAIPDGSSATGNVLTNDTGVGGGQLTVINIQDADETALVAQGTTSTSPNATTIQGVHGSLTIGANGTYIYVANPNDQTVKSLGAGQFVPDIFTYTVTNGTQTAQTTLTVSVFGINDPPVITGETDPAAVPEASDAHAQLVGSISGTVTATDLDIGDSLTGSVTGDAVARLNGSTTLPAGVDVSALIASGAVSFNTVTTDGGSKVLTWTYNPAAANLDWLKDTDVLTINFTAQLNDGHGNVGSQALTITITGTNDKPVLGGLGGTLAYTENDPAKVIDSSITLTDADDTLMASAQVSITGNFTAGDFLAATTTGTSISASYNQNTGVLSLSGPDTIAHYLQVLQSVTYSSTSEDPTVNGTAPNRTISWTVTDNNSDGAGAQTSTPPQTSTINITAVNDVPVLGGLEHLSLRSGGGYRRRDRDGQGGGRARSDCPAAGRVRNADRRTRLFPFGRAGAADSARPRLLSGPVPGRSRRAELKS